MIWVPWAWQKKSCPVYSAVDGCSCQWEVVNVLVSTDHELHSGGEKTETRLATSNQDKQT